MTTTTTTMSDALDICRRIRETTGRRAALATPEGGSPRHHLLVDGVHIYATGMGIQLLPPQGMGEREALGVCKDVLAALGLAPMTGHLPIPLVTGPCLVAMGPWPESRIRRAIGPWWVHC